MVWACPWFSRASRSYQPWCSGVPVSILDQAPCASQGRLWIPSNSSQLVLGAPVDVLHVLRKSAFLATISLLLMLSSSSWGPLGCGPNTDCLLVG